MGFGIGGAGTAGPENGTGGLATVDWLALSGKFAGHKCRLGSKSSSLMPHILFAPFLAGCLPVFPAPQKFTCAQIFSCRLFSVLLPAAGHCL